MGLFRRVIQWAASDHRLGAAFVRSMGVILIAACLWRCGQEPAPPEEAAPISKPNVVWIVLDACRAQNLSSYGNDRPTSPNMDRIAAGGVRFERAYAQSNNTGYSVPSYMTGKYFPTQSMSMNAPFEEWKTPPDDEVLFPAILRAAGYATYMVAANPHIAPGCRIWEAFDTAEAPPPQEGVPYANMASLVRHATRWLDTGPRRPFFLYLHAMDTHFPHVLDPPFNQWSDPDHPREELALRSGRVGNISESDREHIKGLHDGSILYSDTALGDLFNYLVSNGLWDNTVFVISADHGDALGEDGETIGHPSDLVADEVLHVPLIMAGPGLPRGAVVDPLVENVDIVPTLVNLLNVDSHARFDGHNLLGLFRSAGDAPVRDHVVARYKAGGGHFNTVLGYVLRGADAKYVAVPERGEEQLWAVPDRLGHRREITHDEPDLLATYREIGNQRIQPLIDRYEALPLTSPRSFNVRFSRNLVRTREAIGRDYDHADNRWSLAGRLLVSCAWREDAPPVRFTFPVPNATYDVFLRVRSLQNFANGHPSSSLRYRIGSDNDMKQIESDFSKNHEYEHLPLGRYTIDDRRFEITLDEGDSHYWAVAYGVRFVPVTASTGASDAQRLTEREEQLRALGYVE